MAALASSSQPLPLNPRGQRAAGWQHWTLLEICYGQDHLTPAPTRSGSERALWTCYLELPLPGAAFPLRSEENGALPHPPNSHAPRSSKCDLIWKQGLCKWGRRDRTLLELRGALNSVTYKRKGHRETDTLRRPCKDRQGLERCSSLEKHQGVPGATRSWNRQEGASRALRGSIVLPTP